MSRAKEFQEPLRLSIIIEESMRQSIGDCAEIHRMTVAAVVRQAIEEFFGGGRATCTS